ncbi:MAG: bifunctional DNA-formamidopyrimidine glycosylase/DNA-(apurinic or apyrimidinic site) lyase [Acidobacteriota bacterium]
MPELPEVETVVRSLAPHLRGRRIVAASFSSRFVTPGSRKTLARRLADRTILSIQRRGKFIVMQLDQGSLTVHLGMTGRLLLDAAPAKHTYGVFTLDTGSLIYTDPRQFGRILWNHDLSRLGPEPLDVTLDEFRARMKPRKTGIKALLLNQTFLAGMGNIYVDETLFAARVHPLAQASRLSAARVAAIHQHMRAILGAAIRSGGSSISDYVNARGERGWFQLKHLAYGREREPCSVCGTPIRKITVVQRGTHYCPRCQRR